MKKLHAILLIVVALGAFLGVAQASPTTLPVKYSVRTVQASEEPVPGEWTPLIGIFARRPLQASSFAALGLSSSLSASTSISR